MGVYRDKSKTRGNRKPWLADVTMKHPDGRELRRKKRARTQAEANEAERALEAQLRKELFTPELLEKPKAPTMKAFIPDFLKWYATTKKPSTAYVRENHIKLYVLPFFGEKRLDEITTARCAAFMVYLREKGLSVAQSLNNVTTALRVVLKRAKTLGHIESLPQQENLPPPKKEASVLTEENFSALLGVLPSPKWRAAVLLAGVCGLRRGELRALRWEDIDFTKKLIHVKRSLWSMIEGTPKNHEPRFVPMTEEVIIALQEIAKEKGRVCAGVSFDGFKDLLEKNDLPSSRGWHTLRHTALTRMGNTGTPLHILAKIAGHKQLSTTQIYLHTHHNDLRAAAERLNAATPSGPRATEASKGASQEGEGGAAQRLIIFQETPANHAEFPAFVDPATESLFSLVSSLGASSPLLSSSRGPVATPGIYTGEALCYAALELYELAELRGEQ